MSKELIVKAKELGIENAESLSVAQLKKAIEAAEKQVAELAGYKALAIELGLSTEGLDDTALIVAVNAALEEKKHAEIAAQSAAAQAEVLAILSEYLGVDDITALSKEEVIALLEKKQSEEASDETVVAADEGKTDESFIAENGKEYVFTKDAPAAFRCLGVGKTQKEWMEDKDSMNLLIAGNLSFLTLKK